MPKNLKPAPVVGDIVEIEFYDHSQGGEDAPHFRMYGRVTKVTRRAYKVMTWEYVDPVEKAGDNNEDNEDWFLIVKSAITKLRILK